MADAWPQIRAAMLQQNAMVESPGYDDIMGYVDIKYGSTWLYEGSETPVPDYEDGVALRANPGSPYLMKLIAFRYFSDTAYPIEVAR